MANDIETILREKLKKALATLPKVLANEAVNYSLDAFKSQSWDGQQWPARKDKRNTRSLLIRSGRMRRAIRVEDITDKGFVLVNDTPYAKAHNEGFDGAVSVRSFKRKSFGKGKVYSINDRTKKGGRKSKTVSFQTGESTVKAHTKRLRIPQRRFMGKTDALISRLCEKGKQHLLKSLNS